MLEALNMGTDTEKSKHNPDADNLKSLLKKSGRKDKKPNRVVFNETKNEFFDADYIILIREECDFDDEDDESVCTCYQHEMVRLTCCEPNCNCSVYEEFEHTPPSPKFAPPIEFVDAVTLSPPEGYKDMELEEQEQLLAYKQQQQQLSRRNNQRPAVCRECSASNDYEGDKADDLQSNDTNKPKIDVDETDYDRERIDQSQQTTPTSPSNADCQNYMLESLDKEEKNEENSANRALSSSADSPVSGILKGGRLWRQQTLDSNPSKPNDQLSKTDSISDDDSSTHRTVRFVESPEEKKDKCKSSPESDREVEGGESHQKPEETAPEDKDNDSNAEPTEMMLTFKLGNHVLISNNSLKPNSAVRQLFPCTKPLMSKDQEDSDQYLVTAESLRAFEDAKRAKLPQMLQTAGNDTIKRVIERNTLRRSLVRYEPRNKKMVQKTDNSLVERIKKLTCDIDDVGQDSDDLSARVSPTGEEGGGSLESSMMNKYKEKDRNFSPSSSSTTSSNSSMSSTYKKITDLFGKKDRPDIASPNLPHEPKTVQTQTLPDIGGPYHQDPTLEKTAPMSKHAPINESRKQFLSTLAPLTACVSNMGHSEDHYYHLSNHSSVASSTGSEYTLEDIDEGLMGNEENKKNAPDVLAGTPASESGDELVVFVQQDANRIERIKKKYENDSSSANKEEDDENDDYGFNHRPSVRGIKPRFSSTTEILQQIQNQIQMPTPNANVARTYYPENRDEDANRVKSPHYANVQQYRPVSLHENTYQNCANQACFKEVYKSHSSVIGVEVDCNDFETSAKLRNGRPLSPPPQDISKSYHQMMVYIPYNHIEGYQPIAYNQTNEYYRYHHNQINKKYIDTIYHHKTTTHLEEQYTNSNVHLQHKMIGKAPYPNNYQHLAPPSRSESPMLGNFSMARSTQTTGTCMPSCNYYAGPGPVLRYRESVRPQQWKPEYGTKVNRHSFPLMRPKFPENQEPMYIEDGDSQQNGPAMNGYYNYGLQSSPADSPTKTRFIERGVPEGAASISPQDSVNAQSSSAATSPTLPHNIANTNAKPLFYAMNV